MRWLREFARVSAAHSGPNRIRPYARLSGSDRSRTAQALIVGGVSLGIDNKKTKREQPSDSTIFSYHSREIGLSSWFDLRYRYRRLYRYVWSGWVLRLPFVLQDKISSSDISFDFDWQTAIDINKISVQYVIIIEGVSVYSGKLSLAILYSVCVWMAFRLLPSDRRFACELFLSVCMSLSLYTDLWK